MSRTETTLPYWRLSSFYFFWAAVIGALMPYWGLYLRHQGHDEATIGSLIAILMGTQLVAPYIWGYLADRTGQRIRFVRLGIWLALGCFCGVFVEGALKEDYILTARAKGLEEKVIRNKHAAPNAALPVVTSVGISLAFSLSGGALTETVFSWPGIGRELVFAVSNSDYPLAQASFLLIATVVLVSNLVVDVLYAYLDPRIKY